MRIFITGASGCIGHYIAESLIQETEHELFLLVRNPDKLKFDYKCRPGMEILSGDLREIEKFAYLLKTIDVAILAATAWGDPVESKETNIVKTIELINLLDPEICQQVIYFSTASILDRNNKLLKEAGELGTDYIQTKYECFTKLAELNLAPKITVVFPTLVVGGDSNKPYSHISAGLPDVVKWINLARWFKADASFHFIHARDIAKIIRYLVDNPPLEVSEKPRKLVLGNEAIAVDRAIEEIAAYFGKKIYFRIPLSIWWANFFIKVFNVQMDDWSRFSIDYRHFTYQNTVTPETFGLSRYCPNITDVFKLAGILQKKTEE